MKTYTGKNRKATYQVEVGDGSAEKPGWNLCLGD